MQGAHSDTVYRRESQEEHECRTRISRALRLCNSKLLQKQLQGIASLYEMFSSPEDTNFQSAILREVGGLSVLIQMLGASELDWGVRSRVLYTLWNLSALSGNKVILFEEGIADVLLKVEVPNEQILVGVVAIMQNISEYRFGRGKYTRNVHAS